jgi:hypothetical protein
LHPKLPAQVALQQNLDAAQMHEARIIIYLVVEVRRDTAELQGRGFTIHEQTRRLDLREREEAIIAERLFLYHFP